MQLVHQKTFRTKAPEAQAPALYGQNSASPLRSGPLGLSPMNLAQAFTATASKQAQKTAVFWGEQEHSYELLLAQSRLLAGILHRNLGVRPGERVGLWLKNCPEFIPALYAVLQLSLIH